MTKEQLLKKIKDESRKLTILQKKFDIYEQEDKHVEAIKRLEDEIKELEK